MSGGPPVVTEPAKHPNAAQAAKKARNSRSSRCFAPGCESGKAGYASSECGRVSMFGVPKDSEMFERWKRYMPPRSDGRQLSRDSAVCARHFDPQFICRYYEHVINKELVRIERGKPVLTPDAVPTVFPDSPKYYTRRVPKRRKLPERTIPPPKVPRRRYKGHVADIDQSNESNDNHDSSGSVEVVANDTGASPPVCSCPQNGGSSSAANQVVSEGNVIEREVTPVFPYEDLPLPSRQWAKHVIQEKPTVLAYSVCSVDEQNPGQLCTEKLVLIEEKDCYAKCGVYLRGKRVDSMDGAGGTDYPSTLLQRVDKLHFCPGVMRVDEYPFENLFTFLVESGGGIYSKQCAVVGKSRGHMCYRCAGAKRNLRKREARRMLKAAMSLVGVGNGQPGSECVNGLDGDCVSGSCESSSAADVASSADANEPVKTGCTVEATDSLVPSDFASSTGGSEQNVAKEVEETQVPYETVVSGPVPIYVVEV